jgi:hypothetical protein
MDALNYWRLCDELSVVQAALLIVDEDPSEAQSYLEAPDDHLAAQLRGLRITLTPGL